MVANTAEAGTRARSGCGRTCTPGDSSYEIHGNSIPHLHLHLYPRHAGAPFVGGPIDLRHLPFARSDQQLAALRDVIHTACAHR
jgi:hypothetical protein